MTGDASFTDRLGVTVEDFDGRWYGVFTWTWPHAWGGGTTRSPFYESRNEAMEWVRDAHRLARAGIAPYDLAPAAAPPPPRPAPAPAAPSARPPASTAAAWDALRRSCDAHPQRIEAERDWLQGLDCTYGWASPHGEAEGSGEREHIPSITTGRAKTSGGVITDGLHSRDDLVKESPAP